MITADLLQAAVGCSRELAERWAPHLRAACIQYRIDTPGRLAMFLAQVGHESSGLRYVRELWGPTDAQRRYEGREDLGNCHPGDGALYCGRGLIQTTGRANYRRTTEWLRKWMPDVPDFERKPEALELPQWAALSAAAYWHERGCNQLADAGDIEAVTRRINGGVNGLEDRVRRLTVARAALAGFGAQQASAPPAAAPEAATVPPGAPQANSEQATTEKDASMPLPAFVAAALPVLAANLPTLGRLFGSGSEVAERNMKAAQVAVEIVQAATGAPNSQAAAEKVASDPEAAKVADAALQARYWELAEAGGGGIEGARRADLAVVTGAMPWYAIFRSPSFWALLLLLPLVYLVVLSLIGVVGSATWSDDVRSALAGTIVGTIIGGAVGYYWGQTTSRNR